ncbi:MAG: hypothetical protein AAF587_34380 [Bacteroidota bacterium]
MIDPESHERLGEEIAERIDEDRFLLDQLRTEIRPLRSRVRRIQARSTTSISLVGTDGGNNRVQYDPFMIQLVRVVDSSNNEYCLEAITPSTNIERLSQKQFNADGTPKTALGKMMDYMGVNRLDHLSHMIRESEEGRPTSNSWVQVYRELVEWAILFSIIREKDFGTDTLIVFDGLLRSKVFAGNYFKKYREGIQEAIEHHKRHSRRTIYLVGLAKHSKVLARYRLSMALEKILTTDYPAYLEIPREIEAKAYIWSEYARGDDNEMEGGEINKFVAGKMFFVKFGKGVYDPIWPVDIFLPQSGNAQIIMGFLLADALNGFPVPFYPMCLQKAHENAALVDFDFDILQDQIYDALRELLGDEAPVLDETRFQDSDPAQKRY